ncbi:MAG: threonine--tRNA ligase [Candidatus Paceibacterota bacterium]|jgi:threonyl-tRNA synthetase
MENNLDKIRHSLAHLLAIAVKAKYPEAKLGIGPTIENGFYYDFDFGQTIPPENDLLELEKDIRSLVSQNIAFIREEISADEARQIFANEPYKLELIEELDRAGEKISIYRSHDLVDLCAGPHVASTNEVARDAFRLTRVAGAYWKGDEKNKMLTRIYGIAFANKKELDDYLEQQAEAERRDHRKLGKELGLFVFSDLVGKGLPIFGPKGATIKRELERFTIDEEIKRSYHHVVTPDLAKVDLYKKSGHYPYYKDTMYPIMKVDEEELILKPMTCPHHFMFYKSEPHSYRELPYRIGEIAHQYRYEKSGELSGLTRVRMFCLADAHIIAAKDQAKQVIKEVLDLIDFVNEKLGLVKGVDYRYRLSLGDRSDTSKYYKDDNAWDYAESILREVLTEVKAPFFEATNEAAFYGPKIDIQMKKISGSEETAFTVQYDFVMPERFDLTFTNKEGQEERPIVIHRSSIGCLERTIAFLVEKYAGAFPTWLAPVQVKILPISEKQMAYAQEILASLKENGIRVELDESNETLGKKIRNAKMQKLPYLIVLGEKEVDEKMVTVEARSSSAKATEDKGGKSEKMSLPDFIAKISDEIKNRK